MRIPDKGSAAESEVMPSTSQMSKKGKHVRKRRSKCLTTSGKPKKKSKAEEFTDEPDHSCPKGNNHNCMLRVKLGLHVTCVIDCLTLYVQI